MSSDRRHAFFLTNGVANRLLIPLLRSRTGVPLGRHLAVLDYVGRRSGRPHQLVTQYSTQSSLEGRSVRIRVGAPDHKTWWHNFETPAPLRLRLAGQTCDATAHVALDDGQVSVIAVLDERNA